MKPHLYPLALFFYKLSLRGIIKQYASHGVGKFNNAQYITSEQDPMGEKYAA